MPGMLRSVIATAIGLAVSGGLAHEGQRAFGIGRVLDVAAPGCDFLAEDFAVGLVVVHDEDRQGAQRLRFLRGGGFRARLLLQRRR